MERSERQWMGAIEGGWERSEGSDHWWRPGERSQVEGAMAVGLGRGTIAGGGESTSPQVKVSNHQYRGAIAGGGERSRVDAGGGARSKLVGGIAG